VNTWIDVNVWSGQFPFRAVAGTSVDEIERRFAGLVFGEVVVSPLEAVFQEDSYAAEAAFSRDIQRRPRELLAVRHFKVVNPGCSWWECDLRQARDELGIEGIRLCPTFHRYRLDDPGVAAVMDLAASLELPVQVMCKMQDYRIQWMVHTDDVEADQVAPFLDRFRERRLILCGLHVSDMKRLADTVSACPNLLVDTSRLKGPWKTFEKLVAVVDPQRLCFGSLWPINLPECPLLQVQHAACDEKVRADILGGNALRVLGRQSHV
jgi:hypothetical protein